jgi:hypothetical protein
MLPDPASVGINRGGLIGRDLRDRREGVTPHAVSEVSPRVVSVAPVIQIGLSQW